jgi:hypothetical protein
MKFLLLFIGLVCWTVGIFLIIKDEQRKKSSLFILAGGLLIIANCFYLWYSVYNKIELGSIVVVTFFIIAFIVGAIFSTGYDKLKCFFSSFIPIALILLFTFWKLPSVTLNNDVIKMGGRFGGSFKISDIQSADTVNVYPRVGIQRGGAKLPAISFGNYALENERMTAKLCIYRNKPPNIKIRMNDNSLFILNFKEPEITVEFFDQLKEALK